MNPMPEETKPVEREAFATFGNWCDSQMIECTMANADKYGRAMRDAALERAADEVDSKLDLILDVLLKDSANKAGIKKAVRDAIRALKGRE